VALDGSRVGAFVPKAVYSQKSAPEVGRICCPKHVGLIIKINEPKICCILLVVYIVAPEICCFFQATKAL
jgi:hypothetical protein